MAFSVFCSIANNGIVKHCILHTYMWGRNTSETCLYIARCRGTSTRETLTSIIWGLSYNLTLSNPRGRQKWETVWFVWGEHGWKKTIIYLPLLWKTSSSLLNNFKNNLPDLWSYIIIGVNHSARKSKNNSSRGLFSTPEETPPPLQTTMNNSP